MAQTLYAPLNGVSDEVKKILVSTGGLSDYVIKGYCSVGGLSKLFFDGGKKAETIIYYSDGNTQQVYNKTTKTWSTKTWDGNLIPTKGSLIWTDGTHTYYSNATTQYVLNESANRWENKTWGGIYYSFNGNCIWTDGTYMYYTNYVVAIGDYITYVLNTTDTWNTKAWYGWNPQAGNMIWTDGTDIYYSEGNNQYVLNKSTSTWSQKTWNGYSQLYGTSIWTDGTDIYYSNGSAQYVLNKSTSTWTAKVWNVNPEGNYIWDDGENIYYTQSPNVYMGQNYILDKSTGRWTALGLSTMDAREIWKIERFNRVDIEYTGISNIWVHDRFIYNENGLIVGMQMHGRGNSSQEYVVYKLSDLKPDKTYTFTLSAKLTGSPASYGDPLPYGVFVYDTFSFVGNKNNIGDRTYQEFDVDTTKHTYTFTFTPQSSIAYMWFEFGRLADNISLTLTIEDLSII